MREFSAFRKGLSAFTLTAFLLSNHFMLPAVSARPEVQPFALKSLMQDLTSVQIPEEIGKLVELNRGSANQAIVLIQDAHSIPDAQKNIQSLIHYFQSEYGIRAVGLEGASKTLDSSLFRSFPDEDLLKQVFDRYMANGELAGGTAAAIFNPAPARYQGIENWDLYEKGIEHYLKALEAQTQILSQLESAFDALQKEKESVYSHELLEIDRTLRNFKNNQFHLMETLEKLAGILPPAAESELAALLEEWQRNGTVDANVAAEVKVIADKIRHFLHSGTAGSSGHADLKAFNEKEQQYRTSQLTAESFALFLKEQVIKHRIPIRVSKRLDYLTRQQKRIRDIQGTRLFDDFERYAASVKEALFASEAERQLDRRSHRLEILERLAKLELTHRDWEELKNFARDHNYWNANLDGLNGGDDWEALLRQMQPNVQFYETAENRDRAIFENVQQLMSDEKTNTGLIVLGGFHSEGLIDIMRKKNLSYLLVMPQIDSMPAESRYRQHMRGEVSWAHYFEVKDGKVNLHDAFVRGVRDQLLAASADPLSADRYTLKNWRDQIIRDLAENGDITQASDYTRFIDELQEDRLAEIKKEWLANIDQFVDKLRGLETQGQLTEQNILRLLKPATSIAVAVAGQLVKGAQPPVRLFPGLQENRKVISKAQEPRHEDRFSDSETIEFEGLTVEVPALFKGVLSEMMGKFIFSKRRYASERYGMARFGDVLKIIAMRAGVTSGKIKIKISDSYYLDVSEDGQSLELSVDRFHIANEGFRPFLARRLGSLIWHLLKNGNPLYGREQVKNVVEENRRLLKFERYLAYEGFGYELPQENKISYYSGMRMERLRDIAGKGLIIGKRPDELVFRLDAKSTALWLSDDVGLAEYHGRANRGAVIRFNKENIQRDYTVRSGWQKGLANEVMLLKKGGEGLLEIPFTPEYIVEILAFDDENFEELKALFPNIPVRKIESPQEAEAYLKEKGEITNEQLEAYYSSPSALARQVTAQDLDTIDFFKDFLKLDPENLPQEAQKNPTEFLHKRFAILRQQLSQVVEEAFAKKKRYEDLEIQRKYGDRRTSPTVDAEFNELQKEYDFNAFPEKKKMFHGRIKQLNMLRDLEESLLQIQPLLSEAGDYFFDLASPREEGKTVRAEASFESAFDTRSQTGNLWGIPPLRLIEPADLFEPRISLSGQKNDRPESRKVAAEEEAAPEIDEKRTSRRDFLKKAVAAATVIAAGVSQIPRESEPVPGSLEAWLKERMDYSRLAVGDYRILQSQYDLYKNVRYEDFRNRRVASALFKEAVEAFNLIRTHSPELFDIVLQNTNHIVMADEEGNYPAVAVLDANKTMVIGPAFLMGGGEGIFGMKQLLVDRGELALTFAHEGVHLSHPQETNTHVELVLEEYETRKETLDLARKLFGKEDPRYLNELFQIQQIEKDTSPEKSGLISRFVTLSDDFEQLQERLVELKHPNFFEMMRTFVTESERRGWGYPVFLTANRGTVADKEDPARQIEGISFEYILPDGKQGLVIMGMSEGRAEILHSRPPRSEVRKPLSLDEAYEWLDDETNRFLQGEDHRKDLDNSKEMAEEILTLPIEKIAVVGEGLIYLPMMLALMGKEITYVDSAPRFLEVFNRHIEEMQSRLDFSLSFKTVVSKIEELDLSRHDLESHSFDLVTFVDLAAIWDSDGSAVGAMEKSRELLKADKGYLIVDELPMQRQWLPGILAVEFRASEPLKKEKYLKYFSGRHHEKPSNLLYQVYPSMDQPLIVDEKETIEDLKFGYYEFEHEVKQPILGLRNIKNLTDEEEQAITDLIASIKTPLNAAGDLLKDASENPEEFEDFKEAAADELNAAVLTYGEALARMEKSDFKSKAFKDYFVKNTKWAIHRISSFKKYLQDGNYEGKPQAVSLPELIDIVLSTLDPEGDRFNIQWDYDKSQEWVVYADPDHLVGPFENIIRNSLEEIEKVNKEREKENQEPFPAEIAIRFERVEEHIDVFITNAHTEIQEDSYGHTDYIFLRGVSTKGASEEETKKEAKGEELDQLKKKFRGLGLALTRLVVSDAGGRKKTKGQFVTARNIPATDTEPQKVEFKMILPAAGPAHQRSEIRDLEKLKKELESLETLWNQFVKPEWNKEVFRHFQQIEILMNSLQKPSQANVAREAVKLFGDLEQQYRDHYQVVAAEKITAPERFSDKKIKTLEWVIHRLASFKKRLKDNHYRGLPQSVSLNQVLDTVLAALEPGPGVTVQYDYNKEKDWRVYADPDHIILPFENVIHNALKEFVLKSRFTKKEEGKISIRVEETKEGIRIKIANDGPHIPSDGSGNLSFIFLKDVRFASEIPGAGLGLWIAQQVMEGIWAAVKAPIPMYKRIIDVQNLPASDPMNVEFLMLFPVLPPPTEKQIVEQKNVFRGAQLALSRAENVRENVADLSSDQVPDLEQRINNAQEVVEREKTRLVSMLNRGIENQRVAVERAKRTLALAEAASDNMPLQFDNEKEAKERRERVQEAEAALEAANKKLAQMLTELQSLQRSESRKVRTHTELAESRLPMVIKQAVRFGTVLLVSAAIGLGTVFSSFAQQETPVQIPRAPPIAASELSQRPADEIARHYQQVQLEYLEEGRGLARVSFNWKGQDRDALVPYDRINAQGRAYVPGDRDTRYTQPFLLGLWARILAKQVEGAVPATAPDPLTELEKFVDFLGYIQEEYEVPVWLHINPDPKIDPTRDTVGIEDLDQYVAQLAGTAGALLKARDQNPERIDPLIEKIISLIRANKPVFERMFDPETGLLAGDYNVRTHQAVKDRFKDRRTAEDASALALVIALYSLPESAWTNAPFIVRDYTDRNGLRYPVIIPYDGGSFQHFFNLLNGDILKYPHVKALYENAARMFIDLYERSDGESYFPGAAHAADRYIAGAGIIAGAENKDGVEEDLIVPAYGLLASLADEDVLRHFVDGPARFDLGNQALGGLLFESAERAENGNLIRTREHTGAVTMPSVLIRSGPAEDFSRFFRAEEIHGIPGLESKMDEMYSPEVLGLGTEAQAAINNLRNRFNDLDRNDRNAMTEFIKDYLAIHGYEEKANGWLEGIARWYTGPEHGNRPFSDLESELSPDNLRDLEGTFIQKIRSETRLSVTDSIKHFALQIIEAASDLLLVPSRPRPKMPRLLTVTDALQWMETIEFDALKNAAKVMNQYWNSIENAAEKEALHRIFASEDFTRWFLYGHLVDPDGGIPFPQELLIPENNLLKARITYRLNELKFRIISATANEHLIGVNFSPATRPLQMRQVPPSVSGLFVDEMSQFWRILHGRLRYQSAYESNQPALAILTHNRDRILDTVQAYAENLMAFDHRNVDLHVFDDSNDDGRASREEAIRALADRYAPHGISIRYFGPDERAERMEEYASRILATRYGQEQGEAKVRQLIQSALDSSGGVGSNRNWVMLELGDRAFVMIDDDVYPAVDFQYQEKLFSQRVDIMSILNRGLATPGIQTVSFDYAHVADDRASEAFFRSGGITTIPKPKLISQIDQLAKRTRPLPDSQGGILGLHGRTHERGIFLTPPAPPTANNYLRVEDLMIGSVQRNLTFSSQPYVAVRFGALEFRITHPYVVSPIRWIEAAINRLIGETVKILPSFIRSLARQLIRPARRISWIKNDAVQRDVVFIPGTKVNHFRDLQGRPTKDEIKAAVQEEIGILLFIPIVRTLFQRAIRPYFSEKRDLSAQDRASVYRNTGEQLERFAASLAGRDLQTVMHEFNMPQKELAEFQMKMGQIKILSTQDESPELLAGLGDELRVYAETLQIWPHLIDAQEASERGKVDDELVERDRSETRKVPTDQEIEAQRNVLREAQLALSRAENARESVANLGDRQVPHLMQAIEDAEKTVQREEEKLSLMEIAKQKEVVRQAALEDARAEAASTNQPDDAELAEIADQAYATWRAEENKLKRMVGDLNRRAEARNKKFKRVEAKRGFPRFASALPNIWALDFETNPLSEAASRFTWGPRAREGQSKVPYLYELGVLTEAQQNPQQQVRSFFETWKRAGSFRLHPQDVLELTREGLTEEDILTAAAEAGLGLPQMEQTKKEFQTLQTYLLQIASQVREQLFLKDKAPANILFMARDGDFIYDAVHMLLADRGELDTVQNRLTYFPVGNDIKIDLQNLVKKGPAYQTAIKEFYASLGITERVIQNQDHVITYDSGFYGSVSKVIAEQIADLYPDTGTLFEVEAKVISNEPYNHEAYARRIPFIFPESQITVEDLKRMFPKSIEVAEFPIALENMAPRGLDSAFRKLLAISLQLLPKSFGQFQLSGKWKLPFYETIQMKSAPLKAIPTALDAKSIQNDVDKVQFLKDSIHHPVAELILQFQLAQAVLSSERAEALWMFELFEGRDESREVPKSSRSEVRAEYERLMADFSDLLNFENRMLEEKRVLRFMATGNFTEFFNENPQPLPYYKAHVLFDRFNRIVAQDGRDDITEYDELEIQGIERTAQWVRTQIENNIRQPEPYRQALASLEAHFQDLVGKAKFLLRDENAALFLTEQWESATRRDIDRWFYLSQMDGEIRDRLLRLEGAPHTLRTKIVMDLLSHLQIVEAVDEKPDTENILVYLDNRFERTIEKMMRDGEALTTLSALAKIAGKHRRYRNLGLPEALSYFSRYQFERENPDDRYMIGRRIENGLGFYHLLKIANSKNFVIAHNNPSEFPQAIRYLMEYIRGLPAPLTSETDKRMQLNLKFHPVTELRKAGIAVGEHDRTTGNVTLNFFGDPSREELEAMMMRTTLSHEVIGHGRSFSTAPEGNPMLPIEKFRALAQFFKFFKVRETDDGIELIAISIDDESSLSEQERWDFYYDQYVVDTPQGPVSFTKRFRLDESERQALDQEERAELEKRERLARKLEKAGVRVVEDDRKRHLLANPEEIVAIVSSELIESTYSKMIYQDILNQPDFLRAADENGNPLHISDRYGDRKVSYSYPINGELQKFDIPIGEMQWDKALITLQQTILRSHHPVAKADDGRDIYEIYFPAGEQHGYQALYVDQRFFDLDASLLRLPSDIRKNLKPLIYGDLETALKRSENRDRTDPLKFESAALTLLPPEARSKLNLNSEESSLPEAANTFYGYLMNADIDSLEKTLEDIVDNIVGRNRSAGSRFDAEIIRGEIERLIATLPQQRRDRKLTLGMMLSGGTDYARQNSILDQFIKVLEENQGLITEIPFSGKLPVEYQKRMRGLEIHLRSVDGNDLKRPLILMNDQPVVPMAVTGRLREQLDDMFRSFESDMEEIDDPLFADYMAVLLLVTMIHAADLMQLDSRLTDPELLKPELLKRLGIAANFKDIIQPSEQGNGFTLRGSAVEQYLEAVEFAKTVARAA